MNDKQLAEAGLPGVGYYTAAAPHCGWPAAGVQIWPHGGKVGIKCSGPFDDVREMDLSCTTCGWGRQPWGQWVDLARRILAADAAVEEAARRVEQPSTHGGDR